MAKPEQRLLFVSKDRRKLRFDRNMKAGIALGLTIAYSLLEHVVPGIASGVGLCLSVDSCVTMLASLASFLTDLIGRP